MQKQQQPYQSLTPLLRQPEKKNAMLKTQVRGLRIQTKVDKYTLPEKTKMGI